MYRMIIVTALGNYVVEMVPEKEEPTADELMKMFLETKADVKKAAVYGRLDTYRRLKRGARCIRYR